MEKGPPDVSWVPGAPAGGGVGWAVAAAFPAEAWRMGGDCGHRARDPGRTGDGLGAAHEVPPHLKLASE